jgi:5-methylcytosine-specific restriction protein B
MYLEAKDKESVTMIHLFGIRHAEDIKKCDFSVTQLVKKSSIPDSYATEVHKGMRLAKYVAPLGSVRDVNFGAQPQRGTARLDGSNPDDTHGGHRSA